jgi:MerR family transcriptional regulator, copper efflux regulator
VSSERSDGQQRYSPPSPSSLPMKNATKKALTIGQVSRDSGVGIETVRFYERQGLIKEPARKASGYRQYSADVVDRLCFIKRTKLLGFSLAEIDELLSLRADPSTSCEEVRRRASEKIEEIESKMRELDRIRKALAEVITVCDEGTNSECLILEALARQEVS